LFFENGGEILEIRKWPIKKKILSPKDKKLSSFKNFCKTYKGL